MLAEGNSHDEATAAIDVLCELVRCFKGAELNLDREHDLLELNIALDVHEHYVTPEHGNEPSH